jgi:copper chaperone NosL
MAYGVESFKSKQAAQKFVQKQGKGKIMTAKQLETHVWTMNRGMMQMNDMHTH